jgi:hypothetical protein
MKPKYFDLKTKGNSNELNLNLNEDIDTFTFGNKNIHNLNQKDKKEKKLREKKKIKIKNPLYQSNQNQIFIKENKQIDLLSKIETELYNIPISEDDEENFEFDDINNIKKYIPKFYNSKEKLIFQENFDILSSLITHITKLIYYINKYTKKNKNQNEIKYYNNKIVEKIPGIINIIDKINLNMKEYNNKIISFEKFFNQIEFVYKNKNYPISDLNSLKKNFYIEYHNFNENFELYLKIKKIIHSLCNKITINVKNHNKLLDIYNKLLKYELIILN